MAYGLLHSSGIMDHHTLHRRTVLVVDNDPFTPHLLQYALDDAGFETTVVECGRPAMSLLAKQCFDVLIVDVNLPDMNGLALGNLARERYEDRIAILVMSSQELERWAVASLQVCADDFLSKPFHLDEFIARVERKAHHLPKAGSRQQHARGYAAKASMPQ